MDKTRNNPNSSSIYCATRQQQQQQKKNGPVKSNLIKKKKRVDKLNFLIHFERFCVPIGTCHSSRTTFEIVFNEFRPCLYQLVHHLKFFLK